MLLPFDHQLRRKQPHHADQEGSEDEGRRRVTRRSPHRPPLHPDWRIVHGDSPIPVAVRLSSSR